MEISDKQPQRGHDPQVENHDLEGKLNFYQQIVGVQFKWKNTQSSNCTNSYLAA